MNIYKYIVCHRTVAMFDHEVISCTASSEKVTWFYIHTLSYKICNTPNYSIRRPSLLHSLDRHLSSFEIPLFFFNILFMYVCVCAYISCVRIATNYISVGVLGIETNYIWQQHLGNCVELP